MVKQKKSMLSRWKSLNHHAHFHDSLDRFRLHLSRPDALISLALLGLFTGLLTGIIIVLFRLLVECIQTDWLAVQGENYEALALESRFLLPLLGSLLIALLFHFFAKGSSVLGIASVMERMAFHQGYLSMRGFFLQFFGAVIAIASGHSVGREGPNVYLGAASSSLVGQLLGLPNNSIRTLVGCGTAAGIAASFDTPLAGVIFALEVVMMEYTLLSFMPIILAAGAATTVSVYVFGSQPAFIVPDIHQGSLFELPLIVVLGFLAGILSAFLIELLKMTAHRTRNFNFPSKLMLSGFLIGLIAMLEPSIMGIGYDTVSQALAGGFILQTLVLLLLFKLLATVVSIGLGIPGGVIGPTLFLGACLGGAFALLLRAIAPELGLDIGFYSLLGMGAVMGSSLQAPLAALTAMMELTHSPQIIMPGMIAIVVANLTASELFRKKSLFVSLLEANEVNVYTNPISQTLRRMGVASVMNKHFIEVDSVIHKDKMALLLEKKPEWLLINEHDKSYKQLMPVIDLVKYLEELEAHPKADKVEQKEIDLLSIPAKRIDIIGIHLQATLDEALNKLDDLNLDALFVERMNAPNIKRLYGVLTREQIESAYQFK
ncbi:chloride channel protein [sulfur-oxidizing endosymbiont of Gigantopelta aegis]|uniref:chloride channel protein n=1 Tax=sulfur-oxidizing endosymbiont of Gigantopelta aegis TaxID=2794934 RepID=UPI0018DC86A3|nr:chloride channel protein [sulfur-oxidizing endosymbiont of Gigantopelta aegis]